MTCNNLMLRVKERGEGREWWVGHHSSHVFTVRNKKNRVVPLPHIADNVAALRSVVVVLSSSECVNKVFSGWRVSWEKPDEMTPCLSSNSVRSRITGPICNTSFMPTNYCPPIVVLNEI